MECAPSPVKETALKLDLSLMQPEKASVPSALAEIRRLKPDCAAVVAYGQILSRDFLALPQMGCINLHPSLLPRHRGPTPIQSSILADERKTGVTTILLDEGVDTGDILLQKDIDISEDDTTGSLHDKLADLGAGLMVETLDAVERRDITPRPQNESDATLTRKITKEDSIIDWNQSPREIFNRIRALDPTPGCQTKLGAEVLKVWKTRPCKQRTREAAPGEVLSVLRDSLVVKAGDGALHILEVQRAGKKRMTVEEFLRGQRVEVGMVLGK
jgi:methionyl-tRNA formyltransferase